MAGRLAADLTRIGNLTLIPMDDFSLRRRLISPPICAPRLRDRRGWWHAGTTARSSRSIASSASDPAAIVATRMPAEALAELQPPQAAL